MLEVQLFAARRSARRLGRGGRRRTTTLGNAVFARVDSLFPADEIARIAARQIAGQRSGGKGARPSRRTNRIERRRERVDELLHIGRRMRRIALQSAVGGMGLSVLAMLIAAAGYLPPVAGAVTQEVIDVVAVLNALRASFTPRILTDY